jgi:hypothetical protein
MPTNTKELPCEECGKKVIASHDAVTVLCGECTAAGKPSKSFFKDKKLNDELKKQGGIKKDAVAKEKAPAVKKTTQRFGQVKYIVEKIKAGKSLDDVVASIRKDIPLYTAPDKTIRCIYAIQSSKLKGEKK